MIRRAGQDDAVGMAELLQTLGGDLPRLAGESLDTALNRVVSVLAVTSDQTLLVSEDSGVVTGFVHTHWQPSLLHAGGEGFVAGLFVHSEYRGQGIGEALLEHVKKEALARGCARLSLLNMRNRPSYRRGFYATRGWTERPEAANFVLELKGSAL